MNAELGKSLAKIDRMNPNLSQGQRIALASLDYNTGWTGRDSKKNQALKEAIQSGDMTRARELFGSYTHAGGKELKGLVTRRQQELHIRDDPNYARSGRGTTAAQDWGGKMNIPEALHGEALKRHFGVGQRG